MTLLSYPCGYEEHVERLKKVFQRLYEWSEVATKKCKLFQSEVKYIGQIVLGHAIKPDTEKIEKVLKWPQP